MDDPAPASAPRIDASPQKTALVVGANGFLAGYLIASLRRHGWRVLRGIRDGGRALREDERRADLARMTSPRDWREALQGVDAVVNAAGILRETGAQTFQTIHVDGPLALARACVEFGVPRFVQLSALGEPADGEFIASKHRFDDELLQLPLSAVALRPSVVYAASGSYGGTSLLRALAAFPGRHLLPGDGRWPLQPVAAEDLGELAARAAGGEQRGVYEIGGPRPLSLREYQATWRRWLRIDGSGAVFFPEFLVSWQVAVGERLGRGPVGETMWRMLRRGNVTRPDAHARVRADFGHAPADLSEALAATPSQVQDRWQAQLYFLAPALRLCIVALWLISAVAGWLTPAATIDAMTAGTPLAAWQPVALARITGGLDAALALALLIGWRPRWVLGLMGVSVLAYTLAFGALLPAQWLDPLGGLAKNLVVLPALAVAWVLADRR
ncbi:NAD(P)H-binding protein [Lysobacter sp. K5869]|uniref:NAD-dependent epimerase/dehydratase family protein n=1 Tax=Lysobacter sp. K5869 TaxID=2820808 RepID=UPI001C0631BB|nr:NAD-dependent epimerase/dehydratase family protein [Lysobacter sp. K5869]QWP78293.1 NAD(P)H-binding protein [Lysobacter sp. K5869]